MLHPPSGRLRGCIGQLSPMSARRAVGIFGGGIRLCLVRSVTGTPHVQGRASPSLQSVVTGFAGTLLEAGAIAFNRMQACLFRLWIAPC